MTNVFSQNVPTSSGQIATRRAPITVPLFDPVYAVDNSAITFSRSSPWPHMMQDFRRLNNGRIVYERSQVLTPFNVSTLEWGDKTQGTATGNAHASFYANKDVILSQGSSNQFFHPNNTLAVSGGNQSIGNPGGGWNYSQLGTGPSPRGFDPYFVWNRPIDSEWQFGQLATGIDFLTFGAGFTECDVIMPFPLVSGLTPMFSYGPLSQNFFVWDNQDIVAHILRYVNAFSNGVGKNIYTLELNTTIKGSKLWLFSLDGSLYPLGPNSNLFPLTFDDANITNLVNANQCEIQGTNFGWLITWAKATYELIKGQGVQSILLSCAVDPKGNRIYAPAYAPILLAPQTTKSGAASGLSNTANMKIDPNGILYMRSLGGGSDATYVANSLGLDISIPGVSVDMSKLVGNLSIPTFCPCSPVAVPVGGA